MSWPFPQTIVIESFVFRMPAQEQAPDDDIIELGLREQLTELTEACRELTQATRVVGGTLRGLNDRILNSFRRLENQMITSNR